MIKKKMIRCEMVLIMDSIWRNMMYVAAKYIMDFGITFSTDSIDIIYADIVIKWKGIFLVSPSFSILIYKKMPTGYLFYPK
ncbi:hypothetical protein DERP_000428 [Dermatophagoides pteronyssinus]|uniref:Uncharacterized protein n=1 Tax=Dermatophagoides pteronyssinus TaxID=6956 RepID=A0ABQ8J045_DERPT|nr:hypothetical protein DERP_000428 [Dermatophagoides pteronyssinus]